MDVVTRPRDFIDSGGAIFVYHSLCRVIILGIFMRRMARDVLIGCPRRETTLRISKNWDFLPMRVQAKEILHSSRSLGGLAEIWSWLPHPKSYGGRHCIGRLAL